MVGGDKVSRPECVPPNDPDLAVIPESFLRVFYDLVFVVWGLDKSAWNMQLEILGGGTPVEETRPRTRSKAEQEAWDEANRVIRECTRRLARSAEQGRNTIKDVQYELHELGKWMEGKVR
jgi:hypothetical protein